MNKYVTPNIEIIIFKDKVDILTVSVPKYETPEVPFGFWTGGADTIWVDETK